MADGGRAILLEPRDPIIVRDARPFSPDPGARAVTLDWPPPSTAAGALRSLVGNASSPPFDWKDKGPQGGSARALKIGVRGPLLLARQEVSDPWTVYFPAPRDAVPYEKGGHAQILCLRPEQSLPDQCGCDLPHPNLLPVNVAEEIKPRVGPMFWSFADSMRWLSTPSSDDFPQDSLGPLPRDTRTHVQIQAATQTGVEGALFSTTALVFRDVTGKDPGGSDVLPATAMVCRIDSPDAQVLPRHMLLTFGGERRLVAGHVLEDVESEAAWPELPIALADALVGQTHLRLQIVTPAVFGDGWRPGWLRSDTLEGAPPSVPGLTLRLKSAVIGPRVPVGGWDLRNGARATQYAVPPGSVYFFEVRGGSLTKDAIKQLWLRPVNDDQQRCRDGFGLVVPGIW